MTEHRGTCRRWAVSDGRVALGSIELDGDGSFVAIDTAGRILGKLGSYLEASRAFAFDGSSR